MPVGKSFQNQRGFVRGVGMTPSAADRQNKRVPAPKTEEQRGVEQTAKLKGFEVTHPDLYQKAKRFAGWHNHPEPQTQQLMIEYIENAIKVSQDKQRDDAALDEYHRRKERRAQKAGS